MQRPPGRIGPILSPAPNEWINRVNARHRAFAALGVTIDERRQLDVWLINRFVIATLQLEQVDASRKPWSQPVDSATTDSIQPDATPCVVTHLSNALRDLVNLASVEGRAARLTPQLLIKLGGANFRTPADMTGGSATQAPAAYLRQIIETACDWFAVDSFAELNPIEQAAIVFLRLLTIQPFEQANEATALVAASLFTLRAQLPPVVIKPEIQGAFRTALVEADQMNMQPVVELFAESISSALDEMIDFIKQARSGRG